MHTPHNHDDGNQRDGNEITPLARELEIVEASGKNLKIMGTVKIYLEFEVLGGRKLMEAEWSLFFYIKLF